MKKILAVAFAGLLTLLVPAAVAQVQGGGGSGVTLAGVQTLLNKTFVAPVLGAATATSINFGGTSLANYVEGTWTPTLVGDVSGAATYSIQVGSYTRIGREIVAHFTLSAASNGTISGNVVIGGLPLASTSASNDYGSCSLAEFNGVTASGYTFLSGRIAPGASTVSLLLSGSGQTVLALPVGDISSPALFGTCAYHV